MDKLLQLIEKLRSELVPESPIASMSKPQLLQFIEESQFIERMRVFHQKGDRGIRSAITDDEDDNLVPNPAAIQKWRVGKLRKLLRTFHKATLIMKKYVKFSASRLRSHIKRNRYEEMLFLDDKFPDTPPSTPKKKKSPSKSQMHRRKSKSPKRVTIQSPKTSRGVMGDIIINTAPQTVESEATEKKKDCCCEEKENKLEDQDFFALIQSLAPNLYNVLAEKAFLLDMCALDKKRMEANICPLDCNRKAWDETTCCEPDREMHRPPAPTPPAPDPKKPKDRVVKKTTSATAPFSLSHPKFRYVDKPAMVSDGALPGKGPPGVAGPPGAAGAAGPAGGGGGGGGAAAAAASGPALLSSARGAPRKAPVFPISSTPLRMRGYGPSYYDPADWYDDDPMDWDRDQPRWARARRLYGRAVQGDQTRDAGTAAHRTSECATARDLAARTSE